MSKSFKFFNLLQILIMICLTVCAFLFMVYVLANTFNFSILDRILDFVGNVCPFFLVLFAQFSSIVLVNLIGKIGIYVYIAIFVLMFLGLFILTIRLFNAKKYYSKIRGLSFFTLIMTFIALGFVTIESNISLIMSMVVLAIFVFNLIMNIAGKKWILKRRIMANANRIYR